MEERNSSIIISHFVKWYIIPFILLLVWAIMTLITMINYNQSFLTLSYNQPVTDFTHVPQGPLLKGEKISGQFIANDKDLGIISIRFKQKLRIPYQDEDQLIFRVKEKGSSKWYYQGKYMSGLTFDVPFLPFGFPIINNSKGKIYVFELISRRGDELNGVELSDLTPNLMTEYKFSKEELLTSKKNLFMFALKKLIFAVETPAILLSSLVYLMPLFLYIALLALRLKKMYALYVSLLLLFIILYDIFRLQTDNDGLYVMSMIVWIISLKMQQKTSLYTFCAGIILIILIPILYSMDNVSGALKASMWAYAFLFAGTLQLLFGKTKSLKKKILI